MKGPYMPAKKTSTKSKSTGEAKEPVKREPAVGGREDSDIAMRALSIRQPWAEQIMRGEKQLSFDTAYLYASLGRYTKYDELEIIDEVGFEIDDLPRGLIVGTVEIADCEELDDGQYGWTLKNPKRLKKLLKPTQQPNPTWFCPFVYPNKS
jgi:hypothetical protein